MRTGVFGLVWVLDGRGVVGWGSGCLLLVPVGPHNACLVSLVVLVVSLAWWLVIVVCWAAAASLLQCFFLHVTTNGLIEVAAIQGTAEGYHLVF